MKLNSNWIFEDHIDFEYKQYLILAYLQHVENNFQSLKLYPDFADIIKHYKINDQLLQSFTEMKHDFPKKLIGLNSGGLQYKHSFSDNEVVQELKKILRFSQEKLSEFINEGKDIYDFIEDQLVFEPIGLLPIQKSYGYVFLNQNQSGETEVYQYKLSKIHRPNKELSGLYTSYMGSYNSSITQTYEKKKRELLFENKSLPNPATFAFESNLTIPISESFLPIAKRMLMEYIEKH